MGKTLCIVLHYGSEEDTFICIDSLIGEESVEVVVSDNDPSQSIVLPERFLTTVQLFRTGGLSSFSHGNNAAAQKHLTSSHDSLLIINNDTIAQCGSVGHLRHSLSQADVGAVGPCMPYASAPTRIWACGGYINRLMLDIGGITEGIPDEPFDVDYLPGAAILCRSEVWRELGGLPDRYFLAYEEAEFALEIKRLGYRILANPSAVILHKVGMSSQSRPDYYYNRVRNKIFFSKYLYGQSFGFLIAALVTSISIGAQSGTLAKLRFFLWWQALCDDFHNVAVDRKRLTDILDRYCEQA